MSSCVNAHATCSFTNCEVCGAPSDLEKLFNNLVELPMFQYSWNDTTILTMGSSARSFPNACCLRVQYGDKPEDNEDLFVCKSAPGETWYDVWIKNRPRFERWIGNTGFYKAKFKFVVVDTTDPLAVLTLLSLQSVENLVVFAVMADDSSNALEQNTSYVACTSIEKKKFPVIACTKKQIEDTPFFLEDVELNVNTDALSEVVSWFALALKDLIDVINRDLRLSVWAHYFSAVFSASSIVYSKPETAIELQKKQVHSQMVLSDAQTIYLFGRADKSLHDDLGNAFKKQFNGGKTRLSNIDVLMYDRHTRYKLYDLVLLFGVQDLNFKALESGYQLIASKNSDLRVKT